jgi:hypothetical protein
MACVSQFRTCAVLVVLVIRPSFPSEQVDMAEFWVVRSNGGSITMVRERGLSSEIVQVLFVVAFLSHRRQVRP